MCSGVECVHTTSRRPCRRSKQRNGCHVGGVKYYFGDWTLFLYKFLLLFHYANMASGHMSKHTLSNGYNTLWKVGISILAQWETATRTNLVNQWTVICWLDGSISGKAALVGYNFLIGWMPKLMEQEDKKKKTKATALIDFFLCCSSFYCF